MNLAETFITLQDALEPLGIRIGPEVLAGWQFHAGNGHQPLPPGALRHLVDVIDQVLAGQVVTEA